jgi:hypothetical protein
MVLAVMLVMALTLALGSCKGLRSDNTQTTTSEPSSTETTAAASAGSVSAENILFRDDFQDGDTEGWQVTGAWVVEQDGDIYTFNATDSGFAAVPKGVSWGGDYAFKATYGLTVGTLAFSFDVTNAGRYYVPIDQQRISLVKEDASGNKTVLTQAQAPEVGKQHYITMAKQRGTIRVYVDKTLWLAATDASPLATGTVAVGSAAGTSAWVDNVLVNKIVRTLPQGTPAVAAIAPGQVVEPLDDGAVLEGLPESDEGLPELNEENNPDDLPLPTVDFGATVEEGAPSNQFTVAPGTEVELSWDVSDAQEVFLDDIAVDTWGVYRATPTEDTVYTLTVTDLVGGQHDYTVTVTMTSPGGPGDEAAQHGPDLSVSVTVTYKGSGTSANVAMTVANLGDQDANGAVFRWYAHETDGVVSKTSTVSVTAGHSVSLTFIYDYGQRGTMHWKATIDEDQRIPDTNGGNNSTRGTVTIP